MFVRVVRTTAPDGTERWKGADEFELRALSAHQDPPERTDLANAERFRDAAAGALLWCGQWRAWLAWNGYKWQKDDVMTVQKTARDVACSLFREALDAGEDPDARKDMAHAIQTAGHARLTAMVEASKPLLACRAEEFDRPARTVNAPNCTMDLRSGAARRNEPGDMLTRATAAGYYGAVAPGDRRATWTEALKTWFGDDDLIAYVKRLAGYTLVGSPSERVVVFVVGPTTTGKTQFVEALLGVFGDYGTTMNVENLYATKYNDPKRADPELADLTGVRLVKTSEMRRAARLDIARLKHLASGTGPIKTRRPYGDTFQFERQFTIWVDTNVFPRADDDDAFWERVRVVPFDNRIPEEKKVKDFARVLVETEAAGILGWCVEGAMEYLATGLGSPPPRCVVGKEAFKRESSPYPAWFEDCCASTNWGSAPTGDLYDSLEQWGRDNGRDDFNKRAMVEWLKAQGHEPVTIRGIRGWKGVRLKTEVELDTTSDAITVDERPSMKGV